MKKKEHESRSEEEGVSKTNDGHKFLDNSLTEKWGLCPLPFGRVLYSLEMEAVMLYYFLPQVLRKVSGNILPGSLDCNAIRLIPLTAVLERPSGGTLFDSLRSAPLSKVPVK